MVRVVMLAAPTRLAVVRIAAASAFLAQLLIYHQLWRDRAFPGAPNVPLLSWLPTLPEPGGLVIWASMLAALGLVIVGKASRGATIYVAVTYAVMCVLDQARLQPHFTVGPVILLIVTSRGSPPEQALRGVRLALASVYFFAGFAKLNVLYFTLVHPGMMGPMIERFPQVAPLLEIWWIPPVVEMLVGLSVLHPGTWRRRRVVLGAALAMHAFIMTTLLIDSRDLTVIPFNLGLAACAFAVLFDAKELDARVSLRELGRSKGGWVALAYGLIVPVLSLVGFTDLYYAHAYYGGNESRMRWYATPDVIERFPKLAGRPRTIPQVPPGARPIPDGMYEVPLHGLFNNRLRQAVVGEARIADSLKDRLCAYGGGTPDSVMARFYGPPHPITGHRRYRDVRCDESLGFWIRLGGFATIVVGGDGPIHTLEPPGEPTF